VDSEATIKVGAANVRVKQITDYPWDGKVAFEVTSDKPVNFTLKSRAPGWLGQSPFGTDLYRFATPVKDAAPLSPATKGWIFEPVSITQANVTARKPIRIDVSLPMPVRRLVAHASVKDDAGKSAIQRGPVVYAIEAADNAGTLADLSIPMSSVFTAAFRADLLGGVQALTTTVKAADGTTRTVMAIPYFAWANRGRGEMVVWAKQ
jgi:DUF1680 family protein